MCTPAGPTDRIVNILPAGHDLPARRRRRAAKSRGGSPHPARRPQQAWPPLSPERLRTNI
eukprot:7037950-Heterocapsa_arctica.AAC.1